MRKRMARIVETIKLQARPENGYGFRFVGDYKRHPTVFGLTCELDGQGWSVVPPLTICR